MAIITEGAIGAFSARVKPSAARKSRGLTALHSLSLLTEATRAVQPVPVEFVSSNDRRGVGLKSICLKRGFEGFLKKLWTKTNQVYFVAWAWDMSGNPVVQYPGAHAKESKCLIPLAAGELREFIGKGICLFPPRRVTAGLALRIQIFECDQGVRDFGKAMEEIANTLKSSKLTNLLKFVGVATGATGATVAMVYEAARELTWAIGKILQANSDDYVDFYEGYFPAADPWEKQDAVYEGHASEITLSLF